MIQYPYTDFHEMNLDWILKTVKDAAGEVEDLLEWQQSAELRLTILENLAGTYYNSGAVDMVVPAGATVTLDEATPPVSGLYIVTVKAFMPEDLNPDSEDQPSTAGSYDPDTIMWLSTRAQVGLYDYEDTLKMYWGGIAPRMNRGTITATEIVPVETGDKIKLRFAVDRAFAEVDGVEIRRHNETVRGYLQFVKICDLPQIGG